jgi:hypothetical protein
LILEAQPTSAAAQLCATSGMCYDRLEALILNLQLVSHGPRQLESHVRVCACGARALRKIPRLSELTPARSPQGSSISLEAFNLKSPRTLALTSRQHANTDQRRVRLFTNLRGHQSRIGYPSQHPFNLSYVHLCSTSLFIFGLDSSCGAQRALNYPK